MKKFQTIFSVIVSSTLLFNINFPYVCNAETEKITTLYDIYSLQETAQNEYNKMMYEFASNSNAVMTCGTTEVIMDMEIDYPDNYAGACFNADGSQKLDIYLTDDNNDAYLEILETKTPLIFTMQNFLWTN